MNLMIASGNLGRDMETRFTPNGKCIGTFPLPVKQGWGENEKTSWVQCKMFGDRAQKVCEHMTKGKKVTVSGSFVYEEWEKDGVKHGRPVIIVNDLDMHGGAPQPQGQQPAPSPQQQPSGQQAAPQGASGGYPSFDEDDGIPFSPFMRHMEHCV